MRVAVEPKDGNVFAYRYGQVMEGHHNLNVLTGELYPIEDVVKGLAAQARKEHPDARVFVQKLVDQGDGTSEWVDVEDNN